VTESDRETFALFIKGLAAAHGVEASTALQLGYWMGLKDLPLSSIEHAIDRALSSCRHMPKPVELRELAGEITNTQRAIIAWDALRRAIASHGSYRSVDFDDPLVNATVRNLGGWSKICGTGTEEFEKWTRKEFERVYLSLCASGASTEACAYLVGATEHRNEAQGGEALKYIEPPAIVVTGLPPHKRQVVRQLAAPERLALAEKNQAPAATEAAGDAARRVLMRLQPAKAQYVVRMPRPRAVRNDRQLVLFA
jgi:hypothetical protein